MKPRMLARPRGAGSFLLLAAAPAPAPTPADISTMTAAEAGRDGPLAHARCSEIAPG